MPIYPTQDTLNRGELSPKLHGRTSLSLFRSGVATLTNYDVLPQGGVRKRYGTFYLSSAGKDSGATQLFSFNPESSQTYVVEVDEDEYRVWDNETLSKVELGSGQSEPHPFTAVGQLRMVQSNDVMWFAGGGAHHTLSRYGLTDWRLEELDFRDGPFAAQNTNNMATIQATGTTGIVTLTGTGVTFTNDIVGSVIRLEEEIFSDIPRWDPLKDYTVGEQFRASGNVYEVRGAGKGGGTSEAYVPDHTFGDYDYGDGIITARYMHSGWGLAKVTARVNATTLTANILPTRPYEDKPAQRIPQSVVDTGTSRWSLSEFYGDNWPDAVGLYQERLVYAKGRRVHMSRKGNFKSFRTGTNPDDAISFEIASDNFNEISSLIEVNGYLLGVTDGGVLRMSSASGGPMKPGDIFQRKVMTQRMSKIPPIETDDSVFVFPKTKLTVHELAFSTEAGGFLAPNAALLSDHIIQQGGGIQDATVGRAGTQTARFVLKSGNIANLVFDKYQEVSGWSRYKTDGKILTAVAAPGFYADNHWMVIRRTIDGNVQRSVEVQVSPREYNPYDSNTDIVFPDSPAATATLQNTTVCYTDSTVIYNTAGGGLGHLEGKEVWWYAGLRSGKVTVNGNNAAVGVSPCYVGLPYTAELKTLPLELARRGDGGDSEREQRVSKVIVDVFESAGLTVDDDGDVDYVFDERETDYDAGTTQKTGLYSTTIRNSWDGRGQVTYLSDRPLPVHIRSITPVTD